MPSLTSIGSCLLACYVALVAGAPARSDEVRRVEVSATPADGAAASAANPEAKREEKPEGKPAATAGEGAKPETPAKPDGTAKPDESSKVKTTARPTKPDTPPNPEELKARPDENGRVRFNFHGQPWQGVLEWLAQVSELNLDWQELPADYLNLRTQRSYTVDEALDLINRHLLDRGFTLIRHGEVLSAVNVKKIDPSLVPRVAPDSLDERLPHEFVKVSLPLDALTAEAAVEELKPMLSPNGRIAPLKSTNRIEAMDAAQNLVEIRDMLSHEQSHRGRKRIVREFRLEFARAAEVHDHLRELLGLEKKLTGAQATSPQGREQMMQQQQQMMMEMQQMQQQGGGPRPPKPPSPPVHLVVNARENSIIAQAPADQMAIVAEAIHLIDVPSSQSQSLLQNVNRTQVYRLAAIDPEVLARMLEETGELDPTTRLQVDKRNHALIVRASLADHLTIRTLVKKLDGTDRKFEVIRLRRLQADYVAGSIEFMMGAGEKKKQNQRYSPYFDFYMGGMRAPEAEDESRKFRVDADTEHNRLLLWANPVELEEINQLLIKLGEITDPAGSLSTLRVLDTIPPEEADQLLQRLRRSWQGRSPNPLEFSPRFAPEAETDTPRARTQKERAPRPREDAPPAAAPTGTPSAAGPAPTDPLGAAIAAVSRIPDIERESPPVEAAPGAPRAEPSLPEDRPAPEPGAAPPVRVDRGPDGRVIISSPDPQALDRFEDLVAELSASGRRDYKIFRLKYRTTWAYGVVMNLKEFFEDPDKKKQPRNRWDFIYGPMLNEQTPDDRRLSKRRPLKFISDSDSNSILVTGADPNQLKIIEELIDLYDIPESKDSAAKRKTIIVQIRYSKARDLANSIKEVYRDLLSANDPALQNQQNNKKSGNESMYTYINNFSSDEKKPDSPAKFKGQLSIGVVELSNSVLVSAAEGLAEDVVATVKALDVAALPTVSRMRVKQVQRTVDANELQKRLKNLVTKPPAPRPQQPPPQPGQPQQPPNPEAVTIIDNN